MNRRMLAFGLVAAVALGACSSGDDGEDGRGAGGVDVETVAPMPQGRAKVGAALWQGKIAVAGGYTDDVASSNRLDLYDPEADTWSRGPDLPGAVEYTSMAVVGDRLYLVGGAFKEATREVPLDAVYSIGPGERSWTKEPSLLQARASLATVAVGRFLVAIGGRNDAGPLPTVEVYDTQARAWQLGPAMSVPREFPAAAVAGEKIYVASGRNAGADLASVESWTFPGGAWQAEPELGTARGGAGAAAMDGTVCVSGGELPVVNTPTVECLTRSRWDVVTELEELRHGGAVVGVGRDLHLIGGSSASGLFVSDAHLVLTIGDDEE